MTSAAPFTMMPRPGPLDVEKTEAPGIITQIIKRNEVGRCGSFTERNYPSLLKDPTSTAGLLFSPAGHTVGKV